MNVTTSEIMRKGMECLTQQMGIVIREKFDYTKWQRDYFDKKSPEEISKEASEYEKSHPFTGNAIRL